MPFASLRRRTVQGPVNPQYEQQTPSPSSRARAATVPTLSPRKSLSSLLSSARRGRATSPSPNKLQLESLVLEHDLYSEYDASNPDHDPERASQSPSTEKPKRFGRAPSPHPLKGAVSSRLHKIHRGALHRTRSESSLAEACPPKTFLEALADAIRAPASLFYKENKQVPKSEDADDLLNNTWSEASTSPKKSVRFRPGNSVIEPDPRSSPIDIPKATLPLPQGLLAATPPLQGLNKQPDPIPTARPPPHRVLGSSTEFREAIAGVQPQLNTMKFETNVASKNRLSDLPTPLPGTNAPMDNPFDDPMDELDFETNRVMLCEYDDNFAPRKSPICPSPEVLVEREFVANDENIPPYPVTNHSDVPQSSVLTRGFGATDSPPVPVRRRTEDSLPTFEHAEYVACLDPPPVPERQSLLESPPQAHGAHPAGSLHSITPTRSSDLYEADSEPSLEQADPSGLNRESIVRDWRSAPTHEDIRLRFKHAASRSSSRDAVAGSGSSWSCGLARTMSGDTDFTLSQQDLLTENRMKDGSFASADQAYETTPALHDPTERVNAQPPQIPQQTLYQDIVRSVSGLEQTGSAAELMPTSGKTSSKVTNEHCPVAPGQRVPLPGTPRLEGDIIGRHSSGGVLRNVGQRTKEEPAGEDSIAGQLDRCVPFVTPLHARSKEDDAPQTPSPACIPLPLSMPLPTRFVHKPYCDQYGWSPFEEHDFVYAAQAALQASQEDFRGLVSQQGGLGKLWHQCDLPLETAPSKDTRGLALWEIDELLNAVGQRKLLPEPARSQLVEDYKSRIARSFLRQHKLQGEGASSHCPLQEIRRRDTGETIEDSFTSREETSSLDCEMLLKRASRSDCSFDDGINVTCRAAKVAGISEEEKLAKASRVLENFVAKRQEIFSRRSGDRLGDQQSRMTRRFDSSPKQEDVPQGNMEWSDTSLTAPKNLNLPGQHSARAMTTENKWDSSGKTKKGDGSEETIKTTVSTAPTEEIDEDEVYCQGIV